MKESNEFKTGQFKIHNLGKLGIDQDPEKISKIVQSEQYLEITEINQHRMNFKFSQKVEHIQQEEDFNVWIEKIANQETL